MLTVRRASVPAAPDVHHDGYAQRPFGLTLDHRFLYSSKSHVSVLGEIRRALQQREGLVVVTGQPGTGKTLLCRTLVQELEPGVCASIVLDPRVTIEDLLLHVLTDFGVISSHRQLAGGAPTRHQLMRALQHFLASLIPVWGCAVLVIDEAQHLDPDVLEQLRLLLNFETDDAKLLQIVLVGQPELNQLLRHDTLRQLDQRVARRCELQPLSTDEIGPYIEHRQSTAQRVAGSPDVIVLDGDDVDISHLSPGLTFTPAAIRMVALQSRGVPRAINVLCDRALEIALERRARCVDWRITRAAARRMATRQPAPRPVNRVMWASMAASAVFVLAVVGFGARAWGLDTPAPPASPPPAFANLDSQIAPSKSIEVKELTGADSFNLTVSTFRGATAAAALATRLEAAGLPAFIRVDRGLHHVIVGPYLSHAEVVGVQSRLAGYGVTGTGLFVESFEPPDARGGADRTSGLLARSQGAER